MSSGLFQGSPPSILIIACPVPVVNTRTHKTYRNGYGSTQEVLHAARRTHSI